MHRISPRPWINGSSAERLVEQIRRLIQSASRRRAMPDDRIARMRHLELTYDEFVALVLDMLPAAEIHTDNDGQILVYTGLRGSHGLEVIDAG